MGRTKLRHAAALALTGWYLMSPPVIRVPRRGPVVNPVAHFKYWKIRGSYESSDDCEDAKRAMPMLVSENPEKMPKGFDDLSPAAVPEVIKSLVCIPADDPRLKPK